MPVCDREFLDAAPNLKAIFYAAGSTKPFTTEALWEREIIVSTANPALAITVAEFVLAQILLSQKRTWQLMREARESRICRRRIGPGNYFSTIGLISLGTIARHLLKLLATFPSRSSPTIHLFLTRKLTGSGSKKSRWTSFSRSPMWSRCTRRSCRRPSA